MGQRRAAGATGPPTGAERLSTEPFLRGLLLSIEAQGHDANGLMRQARSHPPSGVRTRAPWDELVGVLELYLSRHGVAGTQKLMQDFASRQSAVRAATELLGSPRLTYLVLLEGLSAGQAAIGVKWTTGPSGISLRLELQRGLRSSLVFFQCCAWLLASIPRARGLADARLLSERVSDRELACVVVPPRAPELVVAHPEANVRALARELFRPPETQVLPPRTTPSTQALQGRFGLTRAEAKVVGLLAEGRSIKRIAEDLEVSLETARTHAKRAMQKTDTHRQAELVSLVLQGER